MILEPAAPDQLDDALQRLDRIALGAEVERDQICLAVRKHRDRRRRTAEMTARIRFGERRLDRAVAAVDDDDARVHHRHRADRFADLASSEEHTPELQPLMRISYAVFC